MPCADAPKRAYLFTNHAPRQIVSRYENISPLDGIIAVDNGLACICELALSPSVIIGDMDSVAKQLLASYHQVPNIIHPAEKKETDTELAIKWAIEQGYTELIICNDMQGRFDHALAIVQNLLLAVGSNVRIRVESENQVLFTICGKYILSGYKGQTLSLIPLSDKVEFINSRGLKYSLLSLCIGKEQSRGISNEIETDTAEIEVQSGVALAIVTLSN